MRLIDAPDMHPGCCLICRCTPQGPFVDCETEVEEEWVFICSGCVSEIVATAAQDDRLLNLVLDRLRSLRPSLLRGDRPSADTATVECPQCGRVYTGRLAGHNLRRHMESVHAEEVAVGA
ncbi:MAG TPA: hypothetical protein VF226_04865 [Hyphomicrobiaceae bacterium]